MPLCKEKEAAENWVAATCLQHMSGAETHRRRNRKPRWECEQRMSSSVCQSNYLSHRWVDFPMKLQHKAKEENHAEAAKKKKKRKKIITDVFVLVMVPLQRRKFWTAPSTGRIVHLAANSMCLALHFLHCVIISCTTLHFNRSSCAKREELQQPARPFLQSDRKKSARGGRVKCQPIDHCRVAQLC